MHFDLRWIASAIATLALIAPTEAWSTDAPVLRIAVTADVKTSAVFADADDVVVRGSFTEVGVPRGDVVVADRSGVREIAVGRVLSAAVLYDGIALAVPGRLVFVGPRGRRLTIRAPWHGFLRELVRCGPWVCFAAARPHGRFDIGAVDRAGRLRWRRVVTDGAQVVADADTLAIVRGRRLDRYARRDGRCHGAVTLPSAPLDVALAPGRVYAAQRRAGRVRVEAYTRTRVVRVAATTLALDGSATYVHLQAAGDGVLLQGPLRRLIGDSPFDAVLLSRGLRASRSLRADAPILGEDSGLIAFDAGAGTIRSFDAVTGRVGAARRVAMADRSPEIATGPVGTVVWGDYGSPTPVRAEGLAVVNVRTGAVRAHNLVFDDPGHVPIARAGARTWTIANAGLVGIDDHGGTVVPNVDVSVTALAGHAGRLYAVVGEPQQLVAIDAASASLLPFAADTGCATCAALALVADDSMVAVTTLDVDSGAVAVRAFDPADGHVLFQRPLPLVPFGVALSANAVHVVGASLDGKATSSVEITLGRDGALRGGTLRLASYFDFETGAATAFGVVIVPGVGQVVVGDLEGRGLAAGACGAVLTDATGTILRRWRPCLGGLPFGIAGIGRRVVISYTGGLEVYDLP